MCEKEKSSTKEHEEFKLDEDEEFQLTATITNLSPKEEEALITELKQLGKPLLEKTPGLGKIKKSEQVEAAKKVKAVILRHAGETEKEQRRELMEEAMRLIDLDLEFDLDE